MSCIEGDCTPEPDESDCNVFKMICPAWAANNCAACPSFWWTICPTSCNYCPTTTTTSTTTTDPDATTTSTTTTTTTRTTGSQGRWAF